MLEHTTLMLGRVFNGRGEPIDGGASLPEENLKTRMNYSLRDIPSGFVHTGISAIDGLNPIVHGQRMPVFSANGLPHNRLAAQIARQAVLSSEDNKSNKSDKENEAFAVVFAAVGVSFEEASFFMEDFRKTGVLDRMILFINMADDPVGERINTPRLALAAAEYLAFECGMRVVAILTDLTAYCEALRETAACIPTSLSAMYERAGRLKEKEGSITQIPIFTMPEGDKPLPGLAGYAAEGQLALSRAMHHKGIYPPVDVLPSMSRLRDKGIGKENTREDHADLINQLFSAYARGKEAQELATTLGNNALSEEDKMFAAFSGAFEDKYIRQGEYENRALEEGTLDAGWELLTMLPVRELKRVRGDYVDKFFFRAIT